MKKGNQLMKKLRRTLAAWIAFLMLFMATVPVLGYTANESRSIENFFIEANLLKGNGSSYELDKSTTRMEGIIILIRLLGKESEAQQMQTAPCRFTDVPAWAAGYANYADSKNISKGVSDTAFGTNSLMTAQQFNTLLLRVAGYDDTQGDFSWSQAVEKASQLEILPADLAYQYENRTSYTKKDLIETSFAYLEAKNKDEKTTLIDQLIASGAISAKLAEKYGLAVTKWDRITTNNSGETFQFDLSGNQLAVTGSSNDDEKKWLLLFIRNKENGAEQMRTSENRDSDGTYDVTLSLKGLRNGSYYVDLYTNDEEYDYYDSYILSTIILEVDDDGYHFAVSPAYGQNLRMYLGNQIDEQDKTMGLNTRLDGQTMNQVQELSSAITKKSKNDYEKIKAIHDWVAENIYYDRDYFNGKTKSTNIYTPAVLENRYAVCSGYANLTKDLITAAGIPCKQVYGFALGVSTKGGWENVDLNNIAPNHVWNEAYVDGRWVLIDTTWDSSNRYEGGKFTDGGRVSQLFFDSTIQFLSETHKATGLDIQ